MNDSFLETRQVIKRYANHTALDGVSITVPEGQVFGLLGPNGAGKTTLIRIINRITAPDAGEVWFDGRLSRPEDIYSIGYLPEERGLYKKMKVGEQAIYLAQLKGLSRQEAKKRLTDWFERFEIMPWWNKKAGGTFQRYATESAVCHYRVASSPPADFRRTVFRLRSGKRRTAEKRNSEIERRRTYHYILYA